jgi:hypothetical protein
VDKTVVAVNDVDNIEKSMEGEYEKPELEKY